MIDMKSKVKKSKNKNVPLDINEHPVRKESVVEQEVVTDSQQITVKTAKKQLPKELEEYKWKPGQSPNPGGRPPDLVRGIALRLGQLKAGKILSDKELDTLKRLGLDAADITVIESIILDWATSTNPIKQQMYIERVSGKVPNININAEVSAAVVAKFRNKLTDAELERISAGEDALEILLEKIPDIPDIQVQDEEIIDASE